MLDCGSVDCISRMSVIRLDGSDCSARAAHQFVGSSEDAHFVGLLHDYVRDFPKSSFGHNKNVKLMFLKLLENFILS